MATVHAERMPVRRVPVKRDWTSRSGGVDSGAGRR
jgi:hypothetical protein